MVPKHSPWPMLLPKARWQQQAIPALCVLHLLAIVWWTVPQHFAVLQADAAYDPTPVFAGAPPCLKRSVWIRAVWLIGCYRGISR